MQYIIGINNSTAITDVLKQELPLQDWKTIQEIAKQGGDKNEIDTEAELKAAAEYLKKLGPKGLQLAARFKSLAQTPTVIDTVTIQEGNIPYKYTLTRDRRSNKRPVLTRTDERTGKTERVIIRQPKSTSVSLSHITYETKTAEHDNRLIAWFHVDANNDYSLWTGTIAIQNGKPIIAPSYYSDGRQGYFMFSF